MPVLVRTCVRSEHLNALDAVAQRLAVPMMARERTGRSVDVQSTRVKAYYEQDTRADELKRAASSGFQSGKCAADSRVERQNARCARWRICSRLQLDSGLDEFAGKDRGRPYKKRALIKTTTVQYLPCGHGKESAAAPVQRPLMTEAESRQYSAGEGAYGSRGGSRGNRFVFLKTMVSIPR